MKQTDIKVGAVYRNRGAGTTQRKVIGFGQEFRPDPQYSRWSRYGSNPERPGVEYIQRRQIRGKSWGEWDTDWTRRLWPASFAAWADSEVVE
jgi:hypothetical protein